MKIHTVWAVRVSSPDAPELVEAWDEYTVDNNPEGWHKAVQEGLSSWGSDLEAHRFIDIEIPAKVVFDAFATPTVTGKVLD